MKTNIKILIGVLTIFVLTISVNAQTNWLKSAITFEQGVAEAKAITIAAYPGYAPGLTVDGVSKPWGFGIAAIYPLGQNLFTGIRGDFLGGSFFAASADVGLKADVQFCGFNITPFAITGVVSPITGAGKNNGEVGAIIGGGFTANVWKSKSGRQGVNLFYEIEHWTLYPGVAIHRPGVAYSLKF